MNSVLCLDSWLEKVVGYALLTESHWMIWPEPWSVRARGSQRVHQVNLLIVQVEGNHVR